MSQRPTLPVIATLAAALLTLTAAAQMQPPTSASDVAPLTQLVQPEPWSFALSATLISAPDTRTYTQAVFAADKGLLHLEARYNYESLDTASLWIGCSFSTGDDLKLDFTPMLGVVFGDTNGVAPGYELTVTWHSLELYTEGELLLSTDGKHNSYFYSWSQLTIAPVDWFYAGIALQHTKAYHSDRELDAGPIIGFIYGDFNLSAYALNPDDEHPIFGVSLEWSF